MIYLKDTDSRNGAFGYDPTSLQFNRELRERFLAQGGLPIDLPNIAAPNEHVPLEWVCGKAGTLIIFDIGTIG